MNRRQYYFLVAALPLLLPETESFPAESDFLSFCREQLHPEDFQVLESVNLESTQAGADSHPVWSAWAARETALRNELAVNRAQRLGLDADKHLRPGRFFTGLDEIVKEALQAANPRQAEKTLDRARWKYLDELEPGHHFDLGRLIVYYLKLQLLEKSSRQSFEPGLKSFQEDYARVLAQADPWVITGNNH